MAPDLADRPHGARVERAMRASPAAVYESFTTGWETWFALPGALLADPTPQGRLFFVVEFEGLRHPHYGRFLALDPDRRVELTWLTGKGGTEGAETILSIEVAPSENGCTLFLEHRGFYDQDGADRHGSSWEQILDHLDRRLVGEP
jgi:uncharacterized protein YndB with AHSA1/START domain